MGHNLMVGAHPYLEFLIPGLVAMSSMIEAFAIASEINISRFYWHIFEELQAAPLKNISYVTGEVLAGFQGACFGRLDPVIAPCPVWFYLTTFISGSRWY